jgi:hypothetical protein
MRVVEAGDIDAFEVVADALGELGCAWVVVVVSVRGMGGRRRGRLRFGVFVGWEGLSGERALVDHFVGVFL